MIVIAWSSHSQLHPVLILLSVGCSSQSIMDEVGQHHFVVRQTILHRVGKKI